MRNLRILRRNLDGLAARSRGGRIGQELNLAGLLQGDEVVNRSLNGSRGHQDAVVLRRDERPADRLVTECDEPAR